MAGSKLVKKASRPDHGHDMQHRVLTRSPSLSPTPQQAEPKPRTPNEPYPIPSSNPASQYTLLEKLGTGSFGTVYKAMHNESKQIVAIKQIGMSVCTFSSYSRLPFASPLPLLHFHGTLLTATPPPSFPSQISKTRTTISQRYNRKSQTLPNATRNMSQSTLAPSSSPTSSGSSWSTSQEAPVLTSSNPESSPKPT